MKRMVLLLVLILAGFALAQFTPPDAGYSAEEATLGLTTNVTVYGTLASGSGIVTNSFSFTNGLLMVFP